MRMSQPLQVDKRRGGAKLERYSAKLTWPSLFCPSVSVDGQFSLIAKKEEEEEQRQDSLFSLVCLSLLLASADVQLPSEPANRQVAVWLNLLELMSKSKAEAEFLRASRPASTQRCTITAATSTPSTLGEARASISSTATTALPGQKQRSSSARC